MATYTTEGIVLKRKDFGEADKVITLWTQRFGKISIIAKGVRRITSRRAGNVELLNRVKVYLYKGKNYTLTEAEALETFENVKSNLTLSSAAFHIVELMDRLTVEDQPNSVVYSLLVATLQLLDRNPRQIFIRAFEVKLLSLLGFWSPKAIPNVEGETLEMLTQLETRSWMEINKMEADESVSQNLELVMRSYIENVLESTLKSVQVMRKLNKR
jgi:hypothetical protein